MNVIEPSSPIAPIICLAHRFESIGNKYIFKPMGLSHTSIHILKLLERDKRLTSSDLIKITNASKSNMSQRLSFLEKEGYITRSYAKDSKDKRKIFIQITENGKKKITAIEKRIKQAQISFEKKFTKEELLHHKEFFKKLSSVLDSGENELEKIFKF